MVVKGMRDFPPEEMILRQKVFAIVKSVFEKYGFEPFEQPAIELAKTFRRKIGEEEKLIYEFKDRGGRELALRYDQTVPLVRYISENPEMPKPFKRYEISKVWRAEEVKRGRYREFYQCDIDTIGSRSMLADAEVVVCALDVCKNLGLKDCFVKLNNRKILTATMKYAKVPEKQIIDAIRVIDKLDKIGKTGVKAELKKLKIKVAVIKKIMEVICLSGKPSEVLLKAKKLIGKIEEGVEGLEELRELVKYLKSFKLEKFVIDLSLARGLDYYTGCIFEILSKDKKIGSVGGGGRYDALLSTISNKKIDLPATGLALGIERIVEIIKDRKIIPDVKTVADIYVLPVTQKIMPKAIKIVEELRDASFRCELDLMNRSMSKQLEYASSKGIPKVIIVGPKDLEKKQVTIKDMESGNDQKVPIKEILKVL